MVFEGGKFKITSGDARGLALTMLGDGEDANIYIGKSLMQTIQEFTENILKPNNDIDVKIAGYNDDISEFNDKITELEERMENQRARYVEQFTAMESSVSSFKKTGDLLTNLWMCPHHIPLPLPVHPPSQKAASFYASHYCFHTKCGNNNSYSAKAQPRFLPLPHPVRG